MLAGCEALEFKLTGHGEIVPRGCDSDSFW